MSTPIETLYHHVDSSDNELTLRVSFHYTPTDPGRYNARPEDCYPSTPAEVEITSIQLAEASTPASRAYPRPPTHFAHQTPLIAVEAALQQLGLSLPSSGSIFVGLFYQTLTALTQGQFIGPTQQLTPVDISELLSGETIELIEEACFAEVASLRAEAQT